MNKVVDVWNLGNMLKTTDSFTVKTKRNFKKIQDGINILTVICIAISVVYFLYNLLIFGSGDSIVHGYTKGVFEPLARWFEPFIEEKELYIATSKRFLAFALIAFIVGIFIDMVKKSILKVHEKIEDIILDNEKKQEKEAKIAYFNKFRHFSIAVTFDYTKYGSQVSIKAQNQLNKVIYEKMEENLKNKKNTILCSGIFVLISTYFDEYDKIFNNLFDTVQKIRKNIIEKYQVDVTPTFTIDAHDKKPETNKIMKLHYAIKACNLKNKAVNTHNFYKKYEFMGYKKFLGTSIGLYDGNMNSEKDYASYEVYQVIRNITDDMDGII